MWCGLIEVSVEDVNNNPIVGAEVSKMLPGHGFFQRVSAEVLAPGMSKMLPGHGINNPIIS